MRGRPGGNKKARSVALRAEKFLTVFSVQCDGNLTADTVFAHETGRNRLGNPL